MHPWRDHMCPEGLNRQAWLVLLHFKPKCAITWQEHLVTFLLVVTLWKSCDTNSTNHNKRYYVKLHKVSRHIDLREREEKSSFYSLVRMSIAGLHKTTTHRPHRTHKLLCTCAKKSCVIFVLQVNNCTWELGNGFHYCVLLSHQYRLACKVIDSLWLKVRQPFMVIVQQSSAGHWMNSSFLCVIFVNEARRQAERQA